MSSEEKSGPLIVDNVENRLVEPGRICLIVWGNNYRKLVCIVDFIDRNRVLVDGAQGKLSNIKRVSLPMRWLQVTKFRINIERGVSSSNVAKVVEESNVVEEYKKSTMGRRNECIKAKQALNDFGRFKLYYFKGQFKKQVAEELLKLRAKEKNIDVKELIKQKNTRRNVHPVVRRVTGKFKKKLSARVNKKANARKQRLKRQQIKYT
mmetsp:Transcript_43496/g.38724  ORF Transcript_43496/g.38724 Transcript_43496/m.38724 type:complete len:207 (+) Transcript_43496:139-759(+)